MKKCCNIYMIAILYGLLISCKGQPQPAQRSDNIIQKKTPLINNIHPILEVDTIWTSNAPSRITRKIRKDKKGNLLFAAYEDIISYDGDSFTKMDKEEGLDSYDAFDVWEDRNENVWIASTLQGIFLYPPTIDLRISDKAYIHFTTKDGLAHNRTMCIYEDMEGGIWIGTEQGISYYNGKETIDSPLVFRNFTIKDGLTNSNINTIMEDKSGKIWVGTRGELFIHDPSIKLNPDKVIFKEFPNNEGDSFENVWSIIEDKKGNIWLGGQNGLWRYDGHSFKNLTTIQIRYIYEDKKGNVWFTHQSGFSRYDQESLLANDPQATQIYSGDMMFFGINEDKNGNIWVGQLNAVLRYDGESVSYFENRKGSSN